MPLTRISMRRGKSSDYRRKLMEQIYEAMRETFNVPEDDRFMMITEHDDTGFAFGKSYLGIERSEDLVIIQLTVNNTRNLEQKQALYARIVSRLNEAPGLRPEDVLIGLIEVPKENWSLGLGLAQYA